MSPHARHFVYFAAPLGGVALLGAARRGGISTVKIW